MVGQAMALGASKGRALAIDSTAFKAYSARDQSNRRGRSDSDADVGRAGRTTSWATGFTWPAALMETFP